MVATLSSEPPPLSAARCVCKSFCRPSTEAGGGVEGSGGQGPKSCGIKPRVPRREGCFLCFYAF
ncbi:unnamed protein product [Durusdinium trenchii]|uniref:Uncharacterized protein n=1 Tax=Durusdinium trenchii TaxID=1381693 RepID=A0ABP0HNT6_9DINO